MINPYTICDNPKKKNENIIDVNINLDLFDKNLNASFKIHLKNNSVKIVWIKIYTKGYKKITLSVNFKKEIDYVK